MRTALNKIFTIINFQQSTKNTFILESKEMENEKLKSKISN